VNQQRPPSAPPRVWLVIEPNGNRHFIEKEFLGGIAGWAKGMKVTVIEYDFSAVVHTPPPETRK